MSAHEKKESSLEQDSKSSNALASKPKATPPKVSKKKDQITQGRSPILNVEVEGPQEEPKSENKSKKEKRSFFSQRRDSNEEEGVHNRARSAESSSNKRTTSTASSETSTCVPERELEPGKVRLGITFHGICG